eukprot:2107060-Pyramimonas_sp.AAC.1
MFQGPTLGENARGTENDAGIGGIAAQFCHSRKTRPPREPDLSRGWPKPMRPSKNAEQKNVRQGIRNRH